MDWYAERNPAAVDRMAERLERATDRLIDFPESGRPGPRPGTRVLVVNKMPFVITYRVAKTVVILHLFHSSQDWQNAD